MTGTSKGEQGYMTLHNHTNCYIDTNQQCGETESGVNIDELGIGGECEVGEAAAESDIPEYSLSVGCNYSCNDATPLELFKMLLTDDILDKIVEQTNLYARQYITSHDLSPRSRVHGWSREPFTREELLKFISLIIVMGLVNLPTLDDNMALQQSDMHKGMQP